MKEQGSWNKFVPYLYRSESHAVTDLHDKERGRKVRGRQPVLPNAAVGREMEHDHLSYRDLRTHVLTDAQTCSLC